MSSKRSQDNQKPPQKYDYMKKKQNKGKNFSRDKRNFESNEENCFKNELPEGLFNKDNKLFQKIDDKSDVDNSINTEKNKSNLDESKLDIVEEEQEEYEDFDPSYFEPIEFK
jgi:hypothetical protein